MSELVISLLHQLVKADNPELEGDDLAKAIDDLQEKIYIRTGDETNEYGKKHDEIIKASEEGNYDKFMEYLPEATEKDLGWALDLCTSVDIAEVIIEEKGITEFIKTCFQRAYRAGNGELMSYLKEHIEDFDEEELLSSNKLDKVEELKVDEDGKIVEEEDEKSIKISVRNMEQEGGFMEIIVPKGTTYRFTFRFADGSDDIHIDVPLSLVYDPLTGKRNVLVRLVQYYLDLIIPKEITEKSEEALEAKRTMFTYIVGTVVTNEDLMEMSFTKRLSTFVHRMVTTLQKIEAI